MTSDQNSKGEPAPEPVSEGPASPTPAPRKKKPKSNVVPLKHGHAKNGRPAAPTPIRRNAGAKEQKSSAAAPEESASPELPSAALFAAGKVLRERIPRQAHGTFK